MTKILDGHKAAAAIKSSLKASIERDVETGHRPPTLAIVRVGSDPASCVYVQQKIKACSEVGISTRLLILHETASFREVHSLLASLDRDEAVDGILLQLPLPEGFSGPESNLLKAISPQKDVDGLTVGNRGTLSDPDWRTLFPCTPAGICYLLSFYGVDTQGKHVVIVGRSQLVGRPLATMLSSEKHNATVTLCHSYTQDIEAVCRTADILVVAVGRPGFVTADMVKPGAVIVDVGINRRVDGSLCGDVDFETVAPLASAITPVPGGVGPMTVTTLLKNTVQAYHMGDM